MIYFIDMDFMKKTNDLYGHDMGDSAIKEIASIILKVISKEDIAIRYGYQAYKIPYLVVTSIILIIFVQIIQTIGNHLYKKLS